MTVWVVRGGGRGEWEPEALGNGFLCIGGREAKLLLAVDSPSSSTAATYQAATGVHFGGLDGNQYLKLVGRGLKREQQRVAVAIFRSVRLPE